MSIESWQKYLAEFLRDFEQADLRPAYDAVHDEITGGFQQNFYNQVDHTGAPWPPRQDSLPHPLLFKTAKMFSAAIEPAHSGHKYMVEGGTVIIGIRGEVVPYAIYHHVGTRKMPQRRVIYADDQTVNRAFEAFEDKANEIIVPD